jgi:hypothetical protein
MRTSSQSSLVIQYVLFSHPYSFSERCRLDTIGLAGFSHDFGALDSKPSAVATAFADFADAGMGLGDAVVFFVQFLFPQIISLPTPRQRAINNLHEASGQIAKEMIRKVQMDEREKGERSVMGLMSEFDGLSIERRLILMLRRYSQGCFFELGHHALRGGSHCPNQDAPLGWLRDNFWYVSYLQHPTSHQLINLPCSELGMGHD